MDSATAEQQEVFAHGINFEIQVRPIEALALHVGRALRGLPLPSVNSSYCKEGALVTVSITWQHPGTRNQMIELAKNAKNRQDCHESKPLFNPSVPKSLEKMGKQITP